MARVNWYESVEMRLGYENTKRMVKSVCDRTKQEGTADAPRDTGSMASHIKIYSISAFPRTLGRVGVLQWSVNKGAAWRYTGKLNPSRPTDADVLFMQHKGHGPIYPLSPRKVGSVLLFKGKKGWTATKQTRGYDADPFLVNAFKRSCAAAPLAGPYPVNEAIL